VECVLSGCVVFVGFVCMCVCVCVYRLDVFFVCVYYEVMFVCVVVCVIVSLLAYMLHVGLFVCVNCVFG